MKRHHFKALSIVIVAALTARATAADTGVLRTLFDFEPHVPVNMINELLLSRPIVCKSCGRLLYLPEGNAFQ